MWLCSFGEPLHNGSIHIQCWIHVQDIWTELSYGFHIMLTLANIWSISSQNSPSVYLEEQEVFDSFRLGLAERVSFCLYRVVWFLVLEAIFRSKKKQTSKMSKWICQTYKCMILVVIVLTWPPTKMYHISHNFKINMGYKKERNTILAYMVQKQLL